MITKKHIRSAIDKAEKDYNKCWDILVGIKTFKKGKTNISILFDFQPILATTLWRLDQTYKEIHQEKNHLITNKNRLSENWFRSRMKRLDQYKDAIRRTIAVGKGLGDAFAWIFYRKDSGYITEHLKQKEVFHFPPGIGGISEREFIRNTKAISGYLILYHGITSFLRLGDVSLIDPSTLRVAGIGWSSTLFSATG